MKILLDCTGLHNYDTGISYYIVSILKRIRKYSPSNFKYNLILNPKYNIISDIIKDFEIFPVRIPHIGIKREWLYFLNLKAINSFDVYHCFTEKWPLVKRGGVCTFHDLRFFYNGSFYNKIFLKSLYFKLAHFAALRKSSRIICISESTKRDVIKFFGEKYKNKIIVNYHGYDFPFQNEKNNEESNYFLCVGEIKKHKNYENIIKGFILFQKKHTEYKLIIIGKISDKKYYNSLKAISDSSVKFLGYVDKDILESYYIDAKGIIFLSRIEGFGFPILDAISKGKPLLASDIQVFRELLGNCIDLIHPDNFQKLADKLELVVKENYIIKKEILNCLPSFKKKFSWERNVEKLTSIYTEVYQNDKKR